MKKIRQHNDIDISVILKNTEGEILDPSLCKGIQIRVQTNGNETQIAHYDIFEDGHIVFRFNAKDQTQIGVYDIVISATTTDGRVFTTDVCKAFCIVPCTCCTDNEPGEVETETLEVEATIEITSWGYMYDKRVEDIEDKLERLDNRDDKLQEQIDSNHTELGEAFEGLYDDVEKDYSKKSNTLRHLTLSSSATANSLSLLLEGEYDDSVQGSHLLGPHNIILPYATESKAGVMSPEDKKAILENKNTIETLGLITAQGFQGVDESIAKVKQDTNTAIAEVNNRIDTGIEKLSLDVSALFESGGTMNLPFTDFDNFSKINLYAGTAPVLYIPDRSNIDHFVLERSIIIYSGSGMTAERACASVFRTGSTTVKTSEIRNKNYDLP